MASYDRKRKVWVARYIDIKGVRRAPTFATEAEADERLNEEAAILESFLGVEIGHTFDEAAERLLAGMTKHNENTVTQFRATIRVHLTPILGGMSLIDIDRPVLAKVRAALDASKHPRAAAMARRLVRRVLKKAEKLAWLPDGYFEREWNAPPALLQEKRTRTVERDQLTLADVRLLLTKSLGVARIILHLALLAGLRIGEILALRWSDIDAVPGYIRVDKTRGEDGSIGPTKTPSSTRQVPISARLRAELDAWREATFRGADTDIVWKEGVPAPRLHNATQWLAKEQTRLGIGTRETRPTPDGYHRIVHLGVYSTHRFRAACTAMWVHQGVPIDRIAKWLGHSDPSITLEIYAHLFVDGFVWE